MLQTGDPRAHLLLLKTDLSWMLLLYQIIITITVDIQLFQITSLFNQFTSLLALIAPVPTFFGMCCRSEWQERMYIYKWHEVDQTKTWNILCSYCLQWNTSQSKFRNHYFLFLLRFPYCPNFSDLGCIYIYINIYIYTLYCQKYWAAPF